MHQGAVVHPGQREFNAKELFLKCCVIQHFFFLVVQAMQRVTDSFDIQHISVVLDLD